VQPDPAAETEVSRYSARMDALAKRVIGQVAEALCLVRVPGEDTNRSGGVAGCEQANRLPRGSDAGQVVAEAFLQASKRADFALQNAGGVRTPLAVGDLTIETANKVLPFSNVLMEMPVTGAQMISALEDGVANHLDRNGSSGSHPYMAGLRWDLDLSASRGSRFSKVEVRDRSTGIWSPINLAKTYVLVTNDYLASGKEGYDTLGAIYSTGNCVNTYLLYTQTFIDHVQAKGSLSRPPISEYSHKSVITQAGNKL
jgi:5'-nucleotidase